ncbi:MAG: FtsX-like permease family protein [Actinomycetota bacterium]
MSAVWMRARNDLRARWRGAVLLALVLGVTAAMAMTAAAGARRTTTSYPRLLAESKAYDAEVQLTGDDGSSDAAFDTGQEILAAVAALPEVVDHGRIAFVPATEGRPGGPPPPFSWDVSAVARVDPTVGTTLEIPRLLSGRLAALDNPAEAMATTEFLEQRGLKVGDRFTLQLVTFDEMLELFFGRNPTPTGELVPVTIVGSWLLPHDVSLQEQTGILMLTPAFYERYSSDNATLESLVVRLRNGSKDLEPFVAGARAIAGVDAISVITQDDLVSKVDRALGIQSTALWALALAIGAGGALVLGQAIGRWAAHGEADLPSLRALGMSRGHLIASVALPALLVGAAAALVACIAMFLFSPLVPVGLARDVEPDVGLFFDGTVMALGAAAVVAVVALRAWLRGFALTGLRSGELPSRTRPSIAIDRLARGGASPALVTGVRFAVEPGRGRTAVPVRSVIAGTILSIVAVVASFVFGRSMENMLANPATFGWNWDLIVFGGEDPAFTQDLQRKLSGSRQAASLARLEIRPTTFRGSDIETFAITSVKGTIFPTMLDGSFPDAPDEVALASKTMRAAGVGIGDTVTFPAADCAEGVECPLAYRVVGRLVSWSESEDPDVGAAFTEQGQRRIATSEGFTDFAVRVPRGTDPEAASGAIKEELGSDGTTPTRPAAIDNVARARSMPMLLAGILAVLALITMVHALLTAASRRRHDLAVLKTLGFLRRQVRAAVAWQSMTTVMLALLVGIPVGIAAGRWTWSLLSDRLGVDAQPVAPLGWIALGAAAVVLLANVVAMAPGRVAARTRPAETLRTE